MDNLGGIRSRLEELNYTTHELKASGIEVSHDGTRRTAYDVLGLSSVHEAQVMGLAGFGDDQMDAFRQLKRDAIYETYAERQGREIEDLERYKYLKLPADIDYGTISWRLG